VSITHPRTFSSPAVHYPDFQPGDRDSPYGSDRIIPVRGYLRASSCGRQCGHANRTLEANGEHLVRVIENLRVPTPSGVLTFKVADLYLAPGESGSLDGPRDVFYGALDDCRAHGRPLFSRGLDRFARPAAYYQGDKDAPLSEQEVRWLAWVARGVPLLVLDPLGLPQYGKGGVASHYTKFGMDRARAEGKPIGRPRALTPEEVDAMFAEAGRFRPAGKSRGRWDVPRLKVAADWGISPDTFDAYADEILADGSTRRERAKALPPNHRANLPPLDLPPVTGQYDYSEPPYDWDAWREAKLKDLGLDDLPPEVKETLCL
jgi:hypothetical protein